MPRDAQRRRVYLAETPLPSSPLPGLDACADFVDRVVGTLWWNVRFPEHHLGAVPRLRPGNGARQAFFRDEPTGPTITLPRRYRTKGVVLHELVHWALGLDSGLPAHGRTFARVLLDVTAEFSGAERAGELTASYKEQRVHVGQAGPDRARRSPPLRVGRAPPPGTRRELRGALRARATTNRSRSDGRVRGLRAERLDHPAARTPMAA